MEKFSWQIMYTCFVVCFVVKETSVVGILDFTNLNQCPGAKQDKLLSTTLLQISILIESSYITVLTA